MAVASFGFAGEVFSIKPFADKVTLTYPARLFSIAYVAEEFAVVDEYGLDTGDVFG